MCVCIMADNLPVIPRVHGFCVAVLENRLFFGDNSWARQPNFGYRMFFVPQNVQYVGYCDDFGPMNLLSIMTFIEELGMELSRCPDEKIVFCAEEGRRNVTNCAFLLGAYLILARNATPEQVCELFDDRCEFEDYRDATFSEPDFCLTLLDCWRSLARGKALNWIGLSAHESMYAMDEYEHYDSPVNGELHMVVPERFVAFRSPTDLGNQDWYDDSRGYRVFSPHYYVEIFKDMGITTIIRLSEPCYDENIFKDAGIAHHDLQFDDCTAPPHQIVSRFLRIVDSCPGTIAVHCKAGLGRTGTLIALYLMLGLNFTAREAMGWLRIIRPGCVIGEQQHFLCEVDRRLFAPSAAASSPLLPSNNGVSRDAALSESAKSGSLGAGRDSASAAAPSGIATGDTDRCTHRRSAVEAWQVSEALSRRRPAAPAGAAVICPPR